MKRIGDLGVALVAASVGTEIALHPGLGIPVLILGLILGFARRRSRQVSSGPVEGLRLV